MRLSQYLRKLTDQRDSEEIEMSLHQHEQVRAHLRGFSIKKSIDKKTYEYRDLERCNWV